MSRTIVVAEVLRANKVLGILEVSRHSTETLALTSRLFNTNKNSIPVYSVHVQRLTFQRWFCQLFLMFEQHHLTFTSDRECTPSEREVVSTG
jgi:hypothetical protein